MGLNNESPNLALARARKVLIHVQSILKASRARQSTEVSGTKSFG